MPENFFAYTSLRLKEIGKEIEQLKDKDQIYVDKPQEEIENKNMKTEGDEEPKEEEVFMTVQQKK